MLKTPLIKEARRSLNILQYHRCCYKALEQAEDLARVALTEPLDEKLVNHRCAPQGIASHIVLHILNLCARSPNPLVAEPFSKLADHGVTGATRLTTLPELCQAKVALSIKSCSQVANFPHI